MMKKPKYRMIPRTGVKISVAVDAPPVVLVESHVLWGILNWMTRKKSSVGLGRCRGAGVASVVIRNSEF
jgi:hypothetical protein